MHGAVSFLRAIAQAVVLGLPVAVCARDALGTPAVVDGFSMQVSAVPMTGHLGACDDVPTGCRVHTVGWL